MNLGRKIYMMYRNEYKGKLRKFQDCWIGMTSKKTNNRQNSR